MRSRSSVLGSALLVAALVAGEAPRAHACGVCSNLSQRAFVALVVRSERLLARGRPLDALRTAHRLNDVFWSERSYEDREALLDRAILVAQTAIVRLGGHVDDGRSPREALVIAEGHLRALAREGLRHATSRHGEALVALGDRMPEAHAALVALDRRGEIAEAETYAALVIAARAVGDDELARTAFGRCVAIARARARRVCHP